ncbi:hypothetical protein F7725_017632 [Dissostichus mawsoni]|uniref:Uncharacterized protein n=1 Tax=Dissostichus mawsoni TaxID=36200 RepID=A0A7J5Z729_DISMA|nr:hypothetical protein F7725_017632 [Dissostichus mawsoni]
MYASTGGAAKNKKKKKSTKKKAIVIEEPPKASQDSSSPEHNVDDGSLTDPEFNTGTPKATFDFFSQQQQQLHEHHKQQHGQGGACGVSRRQSEAAKEGMATAKQRLGKILKIHRNGKLLL